jgi:exosome complex RNA-binding protein Rrp4
LNLQNYRIISQETEISKLLKKLGEKFEFDLAIGMNGKIWIRLNSEDIIRDTFFCCDIIKKAENLDNDDIYKLIDSLND